MNEVRTIGEIDLLTRDVLRELAGDGGTPPCVSIFLPTHRAGPQTQQDLIRFRNLLAASERALLDDGVARADVDRILDPGRRLLDEVELWQHLADGLAVYLAGGTIRTLRTPLTLPEEVAVGPRFSLRPLLPLLTGDGRFVVVAVSQNQVRLFSATRFTISQLTLGPIPASMGAFLALEDHETQLQMRTEGQRGMFHGHGMGSEVDKERVERFLRAVAAGVRERIGVDPRPLVLASVGYYLPLFRDASDHPGPILGVEGNPDDLSAEELHAAAWPVVAPVFTADRRDAVRRFHAERGTGRTATSLSSVVLAALDGQVDTLFADVTTPVWGRVDPAARTVEVHDERRAGDDDLVDRAATATALADGKVYVVPSPAERGAEAEPAEDEPVPAEPLAATLRW